VPGFDYYKINQAYQLGEAERLPGGGPELARKTVEYFLGVPVQYYAQIDFTAFVRFIDEIDGVKLDIPEEIFIDIYGDDRGRIRLSPGVQTLPGDYALAYARARNTEGGDFDRAQRQQQVILGILNRLIQFDMIPTLVTRAPNLYSELSSGVRTNLTLEQAIQLAWFVVQEVPRENIKQGIIGTEQVAFGKSPDGLDVLKPLPDQIRILRDQVFSEAGSTSPVLAQGLQPIELAQAEEPRLSILNGTFTSGMAGLTSEYFQGLGFNVATVGDAEDKPFIYTAIYDYTGNPYTVQYFVDLMNISEYRVFYRYAPESEVDVTIILGDDWVANNPMP
ncbi:MAG: LCP family protein, partial [Anaerolineales bacterium]|nr:LCP family protein [Anaerolineales bacterium]